MTLCHAQRQDSIWGVVRTMYADHYAKYCVNIIQSFPERFNWVSVPHLKASIVFIKVSSHSLNRISKKPQKEQLSEKQHS